MRTRNRAAVLVVFVVGLIGLTVTAPLAAGAQEVEPADYYYEQQAVDASWTETAKDCLEPPLAGVGGCVQPYGDVLWVIDRRADGFAVSMTWYEKRPTAGGGLVNTGNWGKCINKRGKAVGWTNCATLDFPEGNTIHWSMQYYEPGEGWVWSSFQDTRI